MKGVKLYTIINFNTVRQKEVACYWELTETQAILREWDTHEIISIRKHYG